MPDKKPSPLYFSVEEYCKAENLDKEILKNVAIDLSRETIREIAEKHNIGKTTVQKYKNKLSELDRITYIQIMSKIYQEELSREMFQ